MEFNSYEYSVEQKPEGKNLLCRILLIFSYALFVLLYLSLIIYTRLIPLGAFTPLFVWIFVFFTWKYVCPNYKYQIDGNQLTFSVLYDMKKSKKCFITKISDIIEIAPVSKISAPINNFSRRNTYNALPSKNAFDAYAAIFLMEGKRCIFVFQATHAALKLLKLYNPKTITEKTRL